VLPSTVSSFRIDHSGIRDGEEKEIEERKNLYGMRNLN